MLEECETDNCGKELTIALDTTLKTNVRTNAVVHVNNFGKKLQILLHLQEDNIDPLILEILRIVYKIHTELMDDLVDNTVYAENEMLEDSRSENASNAKSPVMGDSKRMHDISPSPVPSRRFLRADGREAVAATRKSPT